MATFLAAAWTGLGLILLSTISSMSTVAGTIGSQIKSYGLSTIYEDKDGVSTGECTSKHSTIIQKFFLGIASLLGLGAAISLAVLAAMGKSEEFRFEGFIFLACWALIVMQSALTILSRVSTQVYALGIHTSLSCICLVAIILNQAALQARHGLEVTIPVLTLQVLQIAAVIITGSAGVLLPRRPDVFTDTGEPIDRQFTRSALSKYTFGWAGPILSTATKNGVLELKDLPRPDHHTRSKELAESWICAKRVGRLWINVFLAYKWPFMFQWVLTAVQGFGNVAPLFMLLHILRILEGRDAGRLVTNEAWIWVAALGLSQVVASWVDSWLFWVSFSQLAGPIRAELSSLIFRKSMRRKNVYGDTIAKKTVKTATRDVVDTIGPSSNGKPGVKTALELPQEVAEKATKVEKKAEDKSSQSTVNLIGVDVTRVANFATCNNYFPGSVVKLAVSCWLLIDIIGWKALGAGLLGMLIILPINVFFSKRYAAAQGQLMMVRDEKAAAVGEAIRGIRQIKFSALETRWKASLEAIRSRELATLWTVFVNDTVLLMCWVSSPIILSATALAVYSINNQLTPSVAFTAIGVFNTLQVSLAVIPELTTELVDAYVSIKRIQEYLESPEKDLSVKTKSQHISFENASFSFPSDHPLVDDDERFILRDVNISFPKKELSVVYGKSGSGKSLLLAAILSEVDIISGTVNTPRSPSAEDRYDHKANKGNWILPSAIAFVSQIPWIENATVKNNILFGLPFEEERYEKTIESCALRKDLELLPDGDLTEIGANGINLSGGQKWRLSFARALYSRAEILILDDILSAVDAHVGRHIFEEGLCGELAVGRTRILVTHHVGLCLSKAKYLVELGDGTIQNAGSFAELEDCGALTKMIAHDENHIETEQRENNTVSNPEDCNQKLHEPQKSAVESNSARKFMAEESKEKGRVKAKLYGGYLKSSGGWPFWIFALVIFLSQQGLTIGRSWWLRLWTGAHEQLLISQTMSATFYAQDLPNNSLFMSTNFNENLTYWLCGYVALSLATSIISTFTFFYIFCGSLRASRDLFKRTLHTVLYAPLRWHDTVPLGRILNRFTADFNIVDSRLCSDLSMAAGSFLKLMSVIVAGLLVSPYVIVLALILGASCMYIARKYLVGAREVKRLESIAKSPILSLFDSTLTGIATIRAFDKMETYISSMSNLIDNHTTTTWHLMLFNRWFSWRMSMIGGLFSSFVAALIIIIPGIDAALSGFALFFALEYNNAISMMIRMYTVVELEMNAAERIVEYAKLPTESQFGFSPPAHWPSKGRIDISNLSVTYAPDLPCVLKNLTLSIEPHERVGVVGRTGAGKSSFTLAFFRFLEAQTGTIQIDGLDISQIKLQDLRSRLAIIPQDPVLFSGTVRSNLDPFEERSDEELTDALRRVHLIPSDNETNSSSTISVSSDGKASTSNISVSSNARITSKVNTNKNPFTSLSSPISPSGLNLSQGQRQLLCLARANVSRSKVMILDEATSAVDMETDSLIQRSIREDFANSTLIVIAHRLSTVADFDKILVLDQGEVREFGSPRELLEMPGGMFKGMVADSGHRQELEDTILAK